MNSLTRIWRNWNHGRKFAKIGRRCRLTAKNLIVDGHVELGDHVRIREGVVLRTRAKGKIVFGDRCGCSWYCVIEATNLIQIGDFTGIAEHTVIRDTNHLVHGTTEHWRLTPHIAEPIIIGKSVLIGARCYIGPGVTIGDGAIVAPGSLVTKDIGPYEIWAGNPARLVTHRTKNVSTTLLKRYRGLVEQYGVKEDRYGYKPGTELADAPGDDAADGPETPAT